MGKGRHVHSRSSEYSASFSDYLCRIRSHLSRGHVAEITTCSWHPKQANTFLTASNDSTIRIWDVEKRDKSKYIIVVKSKDRGQRTKITSAAYSDDGRMIAAAGSDGAMHVWNTSGNFVRPNHSIENAHTKGTTTSGLTFSLDNHTLVSRGGDDTVKRMLSLVSSVKRLAN